MFSLVPPDLQDQFKANQFAWFIKDAAGVYQTINETGARLIDQSPIHVVGRDDFAFFDAESARLIRKRDAEILVSGRLHEIHSIVKTNSRWMRFVSIKKALFDSAGKHVGLLCLSAEITNQLATERLAVLRQSFEQVVRVTPPSL